jgi:hypothetical protein
MSHVIFLFISTVAFGPVEMACSGLPSKSQFTHSAIPWHVPDLKLETALITAIAGQF